MWFMIGMGSMFCCDHGRHLSWEIDPNAERGLRSFEGVKGGWGIGSIVQWSVPWIILIEKLLQKGKTF